jgi:CHAT domain-containing protein
MLYPSITGSRAADLNGCFESLPETRLEAAAVIRTFGNTPHTLLLGTNATKSAFKSMDLTSYRYIHIASHGVVAGELPGVNEPALILAWEDGGDGVLTAHEVSKMTLKADLTVLSACNTGNGRYFQGEGLTGMGRAFMLAGSKQVLVSLWPVDSLATTALMTSFYHELGSGHNASEALARAETALRQSVGGEMSDNRGIGIQKASPTPSPLPKNTAKTWDNPYYWSPFVLISND